MEETKLAFKHIENADKMAVSFNMPHICTVYTNGAKEVKIRRKGHEKQCEAVYNCLWP
jgi:hypothetical protein